MNWPETIVNVFPKGGISTDHNYCRNPDSKRLKKKMYCYIRDTRDEVNDIGYCEPLVADDLRLKCALVEPLTVNSAEISDVYNRNLRTMNCMGEKHCNKYDPLGNYFTSCDDKVTERIYAPP